MKRIKLFEEFRGELMLSIHGLPEKGYRDKYHGYLYGSLGYYHKCKKELEIHIKETEDYINKNSKTFLKHKGEKYDGNPYKNNTLGQYNLT